MDINEICLTCKYPRGKHVREQLGWTMGVGPKAFRVEFWQDDICPWLHNMTQPPWDIYLFRGKNWYAKSAKPSDYQERRKAYIESKLGQ
jgi:hypothetical protein